LNVTVSMLTGKTLHLRVAAKATGAELRAIAATWFGVPRTEARLCLLENCCKRNDLCITDTEDFSGFAAESRKLQLQLIRAKCHFALSGSADTTLRLWDLSRGCCAARLQGHSAAVLCVVANWPAHNALSGSSDQSLRLWDLEHMRCVEVFEGHEGAVTCLAADWSGKVAISGSADRTLRLWGLDCGTCSQVLTGHQSAICAVVVTWAKAQALSSSLDSELILWDLECGQCIQTFLAPRGSESLRSRCVADVPSMGACSDVVQEQHDKHEPVHPTFTIQERTCSRSNSTADGDELLPCSPVRGSGDGTVQVWDQDGKVCLQTLHGHTGAVLCIALSDSNSH
jgi:WD40 repeat protein